MGREEGLFADRSLPGGSCPLRGAVTRGGVCCGGMYQGECARLPLRASDRVPDSWRTLHTRPTLGHRARRRRLCSAPVSPPPGRRGGPFKAGWSPSPPPSSAWIRPAKPRPREGKSTATTSLPAWIYSDTGAWPRAPAWLPRAGARIGDYGPLHNPPPLSRLFPAPSAPLVGGGGVEVSPHQAAGPTKSPKLSRPKAGKGVPVAYLGPQGKAPGRRSCAPSAPAWAQRAPGLAAHVRSASVCLWLSGSGLGAARTPPSRGSARAPALMSPRRRSQWPLRTTAGPPGLLGSNRRAGASGNGVCCRRFGWWVPARPPGCAPALTASPGPWGSGARRPSGPSAGSPGGSSGLEAETGPITPAPPPRPSPVQETQEAPGVSAAAEQGSSPSRSSGDKAGRARPEARRGGRSEDSGRGTCL